MTGLLNRKVRLIGDIHGDFGYYKTLLDCEASVQVGDYGLGFDSLRDDRMRDWADDNKQHRFIRGNHDNKAICQTFPNYIPDGYYDSQNSIMYIGGEWSIDYASRREGVSWWSDEENSHNDFDNFHKLYTMVKPRIVISHGAPLTIPKAGNILNPSFGPEIWTRTNLRLYKMWQDHAPELWVFGHWHKSMDKHLDGTRFICLNINEFIDVDLDTLEVT